MSTTPTHPEANVSNDEVEAAIEEYLAARPYSSRFKARNIVNNTSLDASVGEIKHVLVDLKEQDEIKKISFSARASTYRPTPDGKFADIEPAEDAR